MKLIKVGPEYVHSREKRGFDIVAAQSLRPISEYFVRKAEHEFIPEDYPSTVAAQRVGAGGVVIDIDKIRTTDPETGELFLHPLASTYVNNGIDEFVQYRQILDGLMTIVGRRALAPQDQAALYERASHDSEGNKLVETHKRIVLATRPGTISSVGLKKHSNQDLSVNECLAMDIEDVMTANAFSDASFIARYIGKAARREFTNGKSLVNTLDSNS